MNSVYLLRTENRVIINAFGDPAALKSWALNSRIGKFTGIQGDTDVDRLENLPQPLYFTFEDGSYHIIQVRLAERQQFL